ncbi:expressed unknown protein [Seminavis robusta]|uniref:Uncharacterized protein n=1 Tax=Seminavis robusta TaxID=568900 RepID=A0A9N8D853_9STRA|nr:expressed unknown protein [Seminavis robusta]|eukprot:Sro12_g009300.1 n/a (151) ;mRNA; f:82755-83309
MCYAEEVRSNDAREALVLSFSYNPATGGYILAEDASGYDLQVLSTEQGWKTHVAGGYYVLQATCPDFLSIRTGISVVVECSGFDIMANFDSNTIKRMCTDYISLYPFALHEMTCFHTGLFFNTMMSCMKIFLPRSLGSKSMLVMSSQLVD